MAYDVSLLKTRAECITAKTALEAELDGYQNRDQNDDFQDRQAGRAQASLSSRLTTATNRVTYLDGQLARPDLSDADRARYEDEHLTATYQKARLAKRAAASGGAPAFLEQVDETQVDGQVAILSQAIADVQVHHDGLSA
ncbi:hypothetical protein Q5H93_11140 [Hymenobacter sp. ASUV-10]|uniref:Uncharacterized protein n=1 Tax=Hymenobacter aranciens TaxID=3063996 RepID=A0ABT9BC69_9BACT|nr:hypothetical protein [Hymenobacter sp. ASUV-10]MDO7875289.1 hypothetical protein [Hymenobacter sp. ASUV-10]